MTIERILLLGLVAVLVVAPLPFGSVEPGWSAAITSACLVLGALWIVWRVRRGVPALPWKEPLLLAGSLLLLVAVVQQVPLPRSWLEVVSPKAAELRDLYEPREEASPSATAAGTAFVSDRAAAEPRQGWRPISLYAWATRQATFRILGFLFAALIVLDLAALAGPRRFLIGALVGSGCFQAIYGLAEFLSGRQHIFGYAKKYYTDVATGTFINRNHFAGYLEMTLPLAIALAAAALARLRSGPGAPLSRRLPRLSGPEAFRACALLVLSLTMATALICSASRMGIASTILALVSVGVFLAWRGAGKSFAVVAVLVGGATVVLLTQSAAGSTIVERFLVAPGDLRGEVGRWQIWSQAIGVVRAFPVTGLGLGAFPYVFPLFRTAGAGVALGHAHNDFLELAAEVGLAGCVAVLLGLALLTRHLFRRRASGRDETLLGHAAMAGLLAIALHSLTDFNLAIPSNALTLCVLAGMVVRWARQPAPVLAIGQARLRRGLARTWAPVGLVAALALAAMAPVLAGVSLDRRTARAEPTATLSLPDENRAHRLALVLDGDNAERKFRIVAEKGKAALSDLQILLQGRIEGPGPSPAAMAYIERRLEGVIDLQVDGLRLLPTSSAGHLALGRLELGRCAAATFASAAQEDCLSKAMPQFRAALQLNPMSAATHASVVRVLVSSWPLLDAPARVEATSIIARAVVLNPGDRDLATAWHGAQTGTDPRLAERLTE